jgi:hypothetical protein
LSLSALAAWGILSAEPSRAEEPSDRDSELPTRIYADAFLTWIYKKPARDEAPLGYLRGGDSVRLRSENGAPAGLRVKAGCGRGWYAVEPAGYICLDHTASLSPTRYSENMATLRPESGPYPFHFALSMGSPSYRRIPQAAEWQRRERIFGEAKPRPLPPHWQGHEELVTDEILPPSEMPPFLHQRGSIARENETRLIRRDVPFGSMLAVTRSFEANGRTFLQSADGTIAPADRFRMFRHSAFEGVNLAANHTPGFHLPLAWPRKDTHIYRISEDSSCAIDGTGTRHSSKPEGATGKLATKAPQLKGACLTQLDKMRTAKTATQLTGRVVDVAGTRFAEITGVGLPQGAWIPTRFLHIAEKRARKALPDGSKWIHFSISQGTLVTYEGESPRFATLASPGIGGVPADGADPLSTRTTPVGTYRIQFKHRTDDMSPEQTEHRSYFIADVPFAMYFQQPFAIHVAYWHESFGEPMSGGCINVSPKDGERLFAFTDPQVPPDWYGAGASRELGYGTTLVIDR